MKKVLASLLMSCLVGVMLAPAAQATVVATSGAAVKIAPPPDVRFHVLESDTEMFTFDEQQGVTLAQDVAVDITQPGTYDDNDDITNAGVVPSGTKVNSHFIHVDNVGSGGGPINITGTVTTDQDILGIAIFAAALDGSDFLGAPGTIYPTADTRQLNLEDGDRIVEFVDRRTVEFKAFTIAHADQVRIITEAEPDEQLGGEGCTPGYWKQEQHFDSWVGLAPSDSFEAVFGRDAYVGSPTLVEALSTGGGGLNALGRHAVAGLLNALQPEVDYAFTSAQVISMYQAAFDSGAAMQIEDTKNVLDVANNGGCGLN